MIKKKLCLLFIVLVCIQGFTTSYAKTAGQGKKVNLHGKWTERKRAVSQDLPIVAFLENGFLIIQSLTLGSDMTVRVLNSEGIVDTIVIPAEDTGNISIDMNHIQDNDCSLELTNQWGDCLTGNLSYCL